MFERSSGVLLHPTSFPGRYGIGDLGDEAYRWVDFLAETDQQLWQFMPLGPTGYGDSPYYNLSAFAGNAMLISPDLLAVEGFLTSEDLAQVPDFPHDRVDFGPVIEYKKKLLARSFELFEANATAEQLQGMEAFSRANANWLPDFTLFMALKDYHGGRVWNSWETPIARHEPAAIKEWGEKLAREVRYYTFLQYQFSRQWLSVKSYANAKGIKLIGDIPIFVAYDSSEVWSHSGLFYLDEARNPTHVAGVPPDYFSATGQRWGNPLYKWDEMAKVNYRWWVDRFRKTFEMVDIVRIDHFRGFAGYWAVPAEEETAIKGEWRKGPGAAVFEAVQAELGECAIIAEDLGLVTPDVSALRDTLGYPGMKIVQFAFSDDSTNTFLPHNHIPNCVTYTGSHDNDTAKGWYEKASEEEQHKARLYTNSNGIDFSWDLIRYTFGSVANMAIVPLQDILNLGSEARMNFPGKPYGNWSWRYVPEHLSVEVRMRLKLVTQLFARDAESVARAKELGQAELPEGYDII
jgi:4-alpha-glucanotransferase